DLAQRLTALSPEQGEAAHRRLTKELAGRIDRELEQDRLGPSAVGRIRVWLRVLAERAPDRAPPYRRRLEERLGGWVVAAEAAAPFAAPGALSDPAQVRPAGGALEVVAPASLVRLVPAGPPCPGDVELEATFARDTWANAPWLGVALHCNRGHLGGAE